MLAAVRTTVRNSGSSHHSVGSASGVPADPNQAAVDHHQIRPRRYVDDTLTTQTPRSKPRFTRRLQVTTERTFGETRRRVKVIGRLPGEHSCLKLVWAVLDRASAG